MNTKFVLNLLLVLFVLYRSPFAWGQSYKIQGRITTDSQTVNNCQIDIINESDTSKKYSVISDSNGYYKTNITSGISIEEQEKPSQSYLMQNYPNPFLENTIITYKLPYSNDVNIKIYNILGQEVKTIKRTGQNPGIHQYSWDGRDDFGKRVSYGVYFYVLETGGFREIKKMMYLTGGNPTANNYSITETAVNYKKQSYKKQFIEKGYYKIILTNTESTKPLIKSREIENIFISGDTTINILLERLKGNIYFVKHDANYGIDLIYKMNIDGSNITQLTFPDERIDSVDGKACYRSVISELLLSPDEKRIIFYISGGYESSYLVMMNLDHSKKIGLNLSSSAQYAIWSPKGDKFLMGEGGRYAILDTNGKVISYFTPPRNGVFEGDSIGSFSNRFQWHPDGEHLYVFGYASNKPAGYLSIELFLYEISTGKITKKITFNEILKTYGIDESDIFESVISPDGISLILDGFLPGFNQIKVMSLNDPNTKINTIATGYDSKWSNDEKYIVYDKIDSNKYYLIYLVDPERPLVEIKIPNSQNCRYPNIFFEK